MKRVAPSSKERVLLHVVTVDAVNLEFDVYLSVTCVLTLKAPRKKIHLKMSSAEVVCCK